MKNGKVFGKINIIDLLVILIVAVVAVAVALKMTGRLGAARVDVGTNFIYTVKAEMIEPQVYESIKGYIETAQAAGQPGDQLMANGELLPGFITSVTATPRPDEAAVTTSNGVVSVTTGQDDKLDLVFEVQAYTGNNIKTNLGSQEVRVGKNHIIKTTHFELPYGTILTCEWENGTGAGY